MSAPDQPNREKEIFERALDIASAEERLGYVKGACGDDAARFARVQALLQAHEAADGFLPDLPKGSATIVLPVTEKPGDRIGRYKLLQQIGEGGCGVVYMAEQEEPVRRRVALKIIKLGMDTKSVIARFEAERQALALMDHPNIAKVLDAGATETGRSYFVMELVRGIKITDYCDQNHLPTRERLDLFIQVCHAIQHAHQKGIIHRDIKPSNILVSLHDGVPVPVVIDFGIAKATEQRLTDRTLFTAFEQFIGTPAYMSPEQAEMSRLDIDTRSDIYALGVLLYELLTGQTPFDARTLLAAGLDEMRRIIREQEPIRPSTRLTQELVAASRESAADPARPDSGALTRRRYSQIQELIPLLRGDLDWIVMKCLEKDRRRRYETANGLATDIARHLSHQPVIARPPSTVYRTQKFIRRNKLMVGAAGLIALALVLGIAVSTWQAIRAMRAEGRAEKARLGEAAQRQVAEGRAEESRRRLVQVNVASGLRLMNEGQLFAALPWLVEALRLEEGRPEGEDLQRRRLGAVLEQCPRLAQIWFHDGPVNCAAFSPDGRHVATGTGRKVALLMDKGTPGQVQVWDVETGQRVGRPLVHDSSISQLRFSPDGRRIATASADGTARVWDANTGEPVTPPLPHSNSVVGLVFSRDGTLVATASHDNTARVWDAQNGQPVSGQLPHIAAVWAVDFSPDGTRLVSVSTDACLHLWDVKSGTNILERREHSNEIFGGIRWSPDGSRWVTASGDWTAKLWDASKGEVLATFQHDEEVNWAAFSPDGQQVVTASVDSTARVWNALTGAPITPPIRHGGWLFYAEFSPDGLMVATASRDRTARVWDAATGRPLTPPLHHGDEVRQAVFSPAGHHLLTVSYDGTARLWELAVGGPFADLPHRLPVTRIALSPDNRRVLTASADRTAQVWDLNTGDPIGSPIQHLRGVSEAAFSPDGQGILTASYDRMARVWEAGTGKPVTPPMMHREGIVHAVFSPDGRRVATASTDRTAAVWDARTGQRITPFLIHDREVQWVAFSPDGQRLITASRDRLARVWDATIGKELLRLKGHKDWVLQAMFGPDGRQILTASTDKTAAVWDAVSGQQRVTLGHGDLVMAAGFNANGKRIVTASYDGTARVWDAETGRAITPPLRHDGVVEQAVFSSDGRWVVTASWDQTVRLWSATTGDPIAPAVRLGEGAHDARLSLDGQRLITASGAAAQLWNLAREARPVADLVLLTQLLTGQATDAQGQVMPLDVEATQKAWQTLKAKPGEPRDGSPTADRAWHRQALAQALTRQQEFAVRWHVDRLLEPLPEDESLRRLRANLVSHPAGSATGGWTVSDRLAEPRSRIPPQETGTPENLIDLSDHYSRSLSDGFEEWFRWNEVNNLSGLSRGIRTLAGVRFDVRGRVQLQGTQAKATGFPWPDRITGIRVGRLCRSLHFLHGTGWVETEGKEIARYVIHFADGQQSERSVRYGNDVRDTWLKANDPPEHPDAVRAWVGTNALTAETGIAFRFYKSVWENPRPEVPVETIDFISTMSDCAPVLIAITAE